MSAAAGIVVCPMRFTGQMAEMTSFLELIGLRKVIGKDHRYAVFQGRGGMVALHSLDSAASTDETTTGLTLVVPDAVAAVDALIERGLDARWWDEAFGRQASVAGPYGELSLNEVMGDHYGYDVDDPASPSPVDVVASVFTPDPDEATDYFAEFGFVAGPDAAPA